MTALKTGDFDAQILDWMRECEAELLQAEPKAQFFYLSFGGENTGFFFSKPLQVALIADKSTRPVNYTVLEPYFYNCVSGDDLDRLCQALLIIIINKVKTIEMQHLKGFSPSLTELAQVDFFKHYLASYPNNNAKIKSLLSF